MAEGSVLSNSQIIIWPKGTPALFEVGLDSEGDNMKQLNNAEQSAVCVILNFVFIIVER